MIKNTANGASANLMTSGSMCIVQPNFLPVSSAIAAEYFCTERYLFDCHDADLAVLIKCYSGIILKRRLNQARSIIGIFGKTLHGHGIHNSTIGHVDEVGIGTVCSSAPGLRIG